MDEIKEAILEIRQDVKELKGDVKEISRILDRNTGSLIIHEARTTLAERRIERFESVSKWILGLIASGVFALLAKLLTK